MAGMQDGDLEEPLRWHVHELAEVTRGLTGAVRGLADAATLPDAHGYW